MRERTSNVVAYYRVSTATKQGKSGLGLEAQRATVAAYLKDRSCTVVEEFTEVESDKISNRPALEAAVAAARLHRAALVVSKVDRLNRSVAFPLASSKRAWTFGSMLTLEAGHEVTLWNRARYVERGSRRGNVSNDAAGSQPVTICRVDFA